MRRAPQVASAVILILGLSACSGVQKQLVGEKSSPDEFRVSSQAPLSLPPDFRLRPPEPGAVRPQSGTPTQQARQSVFRLNSAGTPSRVYNDAGRQSAGEQALVSRVGSQRVDPKIRQIVDLETDQINEESGSLLETLIFWREEEPSGTLVDASAEAQRLRLNRSLNRPVNAGETPTIKRRERGLLEGIFD